MSDTPETDALIEEIRSKPSKGGCIPKDFARKLERERNEARARGDTYGQKYAACILEREKLKAELKQMSMCLDASNDARSMIGNERDQLRKVADEFADRIKSVRPIVREDGSQDDWLDCHLDEILRGYNSLPHVIERNKSK